METIQSLRMVAERCRREMECARSQCYNLADQSVYREHSLLLVYIANTIVLAPQRRKFVIDDDNRQILRFMLYYFNGCPIAEEVFPGRGYKLHKSLLLQGGVGVGKTLLMQVFAEYLRRTRNPMAFDNLSVTQMVNHYAIHNNIDKFTFREEERCQPANVCLHDVGIQDKTFYGMDTGLLTDEFLHARSEIWAQYGKYAHITTNLNNDQLVRRFSRNDAYGRLTDRLKMYNVIPMPGKSRR